MPHSKGNRLCRDLVRLQIVFFHEFALITAKIIIIKFDNYLKLEFYIFDDLYKNDIFMAVIS